MIAQKNDGKEVDSQQAFFINVEVGKVFEDKDKDVALTTTFVEQELIPVTIGTTT